MNLPTFVHEMGAAELIAFMLGISIGWGLCVKIRVENLRKETDRLNLKYDDLITRIQAEFWGRR